MRLNIGLSDEDSQDNLFANTSDSGVGPSPREPGRGGLEDSDPPPWLRDVRLNFILEGGGVGVDRVPVSDLLVR